VIDDLVCTYTEAHHFRRITSFRQLSSIYFFSALMLLCLVTGMLSSL